MLEENESDIFESISLFYKEFMVNVCSKCIVN